MTTSNEPLCLTDLYESSPGLRRLAHGYASSGTWRRLAVRGFYVGRDVVANLPRDLASAVRAAPVAPLRMEDGVAMEAGSKRIALYVHYSPTGQVSDMVRRQLSLLAGTGFSIVFISMAARIPEADWQAVRRLCALVVQRQNIGRDFGAWHDLMPEVARRWSEPVELMLVNDSVLGPIGALEPVIATMRAGGDGLFGLTESLQGGAHLQSYMLLARGRGAVADLMGFLSAMHISHSKWLLIQLGEIRLARWMRRRGHRVAAVFGYDRLAQAAAADPAERERLAKSYHRLKGFATLPDDQAAALLHQWPLNPTHHLWHVLATRFGGPFLKTELVMRNPGRLPGVAEWAAVVPPDAPCPLPMLRAHLETMRAA
nr:rhamnan synthesis F family protein [uncultured Rhodopila sp.]